LFSQNGVRQFPGSPESYKLASGREPEQRRTNPCKTLFKSAYRHKTGWAGLFLNLSFIG
jgi:hypothetical protein